jgi:hypothetical protein
LPLVEHRIYIGRVPGVPVSKYGESALHTIKYWLKIVFASEKEVRVLNDRERTFMNKTSTQIVVDRILIRELPCNAVMAQIVKTIAIEAVSHREMRPEIPMCACAANPTCGIPDE